EDGAGLERGLPPAGVALIEPPLANDAVLTAAALRATKAGGPAPPPNRRLTLLFRAKLFEESRKAQTILELDRIARHATSPASCDGANDINHLWREPDRPG